MNNRFEDFLALHKNETPLLLGNVWNVQSAKTFEQQNFKAIGTSSAAAAETLGLTDGEGMSFADYLFIIKHIASSVTIPVTVDLETGYGTTAEQICANIAKLYSMGVSGINVEDSTITDGQRTITDAKVFAQKLQHITKLLDADHIQMFINVRTDSFLLGVPNALEDALARIQLYQHTGVHGLFLPGVTKLADIEQVTAMTKLPVNVMCMPDLPDFKQLQQAGVKRISMGPFLYRHFYKTLDTSVARIVADGSFKSLF